MNKHLQPNIFQQRFFQTPLARLGFHLIGNPNYLTSKWCRLGPSYFKSKPSKGTPKNQQKLVILSQLCLVTGSLSKQMFHGILHNQTNPYIFLRFEPWSGTCFSQDVPSKDERLTYCYWKGVFSLVKNLPTFASTSPVCRSARGDSSQKQGPKF